MARYRDFDIVFCRNVLIYFDDASRRMAAENLYDCLRSGGLHLSRAFRNDEPDFAACSAFVGFPTRSSIKGRRGTMTDIKTAAMRSALPRLRIV